MAETLMTVEKIDAVIREIWPYLGRDVAKLVRDTAVARIDRLLEERYAVDPVDRHVRYVLTNGAPADPSEPKEHRV